MKKKLLLLFLAVISCVCLAFGFAACTGETGATGAQGEKGETGATGAAGEDGEDGVGIASVDFNEYNDFVITYTDGTTTTLGWHGTAYNPYEILPAMYSETGVFYDTFDVEADSTVYFVLEVNKTTDVYIGGVTKNDTIEGITATWDSDYSYYTATLSEGNYYIAVKNESLTEEATVELTAAIKGSYAHPYTEDDYMYVGTWWTYWNFDTPALKAGETIYFQTGSEAMTYDIYSDIATVYAVYDDNTKITITEGEGLYAFGANALIAVTNETKETIAAGWNFEISQHEGTGTETDPYLLYASDFVDDNGNAYGSYDCYYDYYYIYGGDSVYYSVVTGGYTVTLFIDYLSGDEYENLSITIDGETVTLNAAHKVTFSCISPVTIVLTNNNTDTTSYIWPDVYMLVYDLAVDGGETYICVESYGSNGSYGYNSVDDKEFDIVEAGTYRVYVSDPAAYLEMYYFDSSYIYHTIAELDGNAEEDWTLVTDTTSSYYGYYYVDFTVAETDLTTEGYITITVSISANVVTVDTEGNKTYSWYSTTELDNLEFYLAIETVTATETDTSSAS